MGSLKAHMKVSLWFKPVLYSFCSTHRYVLSAHCINITVLFVNGINLIDGDILQNGYGSIF